jgi:hypothetical protein
MGIRNLKTMGPDNRGRREEAEGAHAGHDETCRCKETSKMSPQELLRLMMSDLAFWKKTKKD